MSHVVLVAAGMLLMLLIQLLLRSGHGLAWRGAAAGKGDSLGTVSTNIGPWGRLEYVPIALDRPENYFTNDPGPVGKSVWVFRNHTEQQLAALFGSLELTDRTRAYLLDRANWEFLPRAIRISPTPEVVISLSAGTRKQLYELLASNPENIPQAMPFRFRPDGFDEWFADCGLGKDKLELVRRLTYSQQGNLCFADATTFAQLSTPEETKCLVRSLWRVSTFEMKVHIDSSTDIDALLKYWGAQGRARAYKPLLESMSRVPEGSSVNVTFFLPPFARLRLYTYPSPRDPNIMKQDCFWTAMNFFNTSPDDAFFNPEHTQRVLRSEYARISDGTKQFGDLLVLLGPEQQALHMCVYIADDAVFTKNGANTQQPWVLMKLSEMLGEYETQKPFEIITYRRKTPPPLSAIGGFSSSARSL
jgi:hypothetical protein